MVKFALSTEGYPSLTHSFGVNPKLRTTKFSPKKLETLIYRMVFTYLRFVTVQSLRAKIDLKSPFLKGVCHFGPIFQVEWDVPTNHLCTDRRPVNALQLAAESFHTKKLCSRLSSRKVPFSIRKMEIIAFEAPLGVRGHVRCSS